MKVTLSNNFGDIVINCYCVELSVDRTHIMCHQYPPEDSIEFDLDKFTLCNIQDKK